MFAVRVRVKATSVVIKPTVELAARRYAEASRQPGRYWYEVERILTSLPREIRELPVEQISRQDIRCLLLEYKDRPAACRNLYSTLRTMLQWATDTELIRTNPMSDMKAPRGVAARERILSVPELQLLVKTINLLDFPWRPFLQLLVRLGQRRKEISDIKWSELDLVTGQPDWLIPRQRTKNRREHHVPLPRQCYVILSAIPPGDSDYILTTNSRTPISGYHKCKALVDDLAPIQPWRLHDLRRTMATGMTRYCKVPRFIVGQVLNHTLDSAKVTAIYDRYDYYDEKLEALTKWNDYLDTLIG